MRKPSRSPARRMFESLARRARASGISETGMISAAPFANAVSVVVVARKMWKTTQVVWERSRERRVEYSVGEKRTSMRLSDIGAMVEVSPSVSKPLRAHVVEEVLLGVAGVGTEMGLDEFLQTLVGRFAFGEVKLADRFLDPDLDWKGVLKSVGEEEDAFRDFSAAARESVQVFRTLFQSMSGSKKRSA